MTEWILKMSVFVDWVGVYKVEAGLEMLKRQTSSLECSIEGKRESTQKEWQER